MSDNGYALDLLSAARHVATELDRVAPAALSFPELATGYKHPNPGDIARVKMHEGCTTNDDARDWIVKEALGEIAYRGKTSRSKQQLITTDDGTYVLAKDVTVGEGLDTDVLYQGRRLHRERDDHAQLRDPFNPMSGEFADNIRRITGKDSVAEAELRESMSTFGWVEEFPAIKDERGVVLVGHRRLAVAKDLGIEPVVKTVHLGDGDEGDARRFRLAIASNLGSKAFTPDERKRLGEYLYGEKDWTMARIADALSVSKGTISRDLRGLLQPATTSRPKGGRPKKERGAPPEDLRDRDREIGNLYFDQEKSRIDIADVLGIGEHAVQLAIERERVRRKDHPRPPATPEHQAEASVDPIAASEPDTHACPACGHMHTRADIGI